MKTPATYRPWTVEGGRVITNGSVRFYLAGCKEPNQSYAYEPVWLDRLAYTVAALLNEVRDTGAVQS